MPVSINGNTGVITGLAVGGLPDGTIDADSLASNAVTSAKLASGVGGKILQVVSTTKTDTASFSVASGATYSYTDTSFRATITPSSASNKILIQVMAHISVDSEQWIHVTLQKDGSTISGAIGDAAGSRNRVTHFQGYPPGTFNKTVPVPITFQDTAGSTSSRYYNLALAHTSGLTRTMYFNRSGQGDTDAFQYARTISTITVMEVAA